MAAQFAPLYAILLAYPFRGDSLRFRICSVDVIFFLLLISAAITAWSTEIFETGINSLRTDFFTLTAPYLLARIVFKNWEMRRAALFVMMGLMGFIFLAALIEFRLTPYFYLHMLQNMGMGKQDPGDGLHPLRFLPRRGARSSIRSTLAICAWCCSA